MQVNCAFLCLTVVLFQIPPIVEDVALGSLGNQEPALGWDQGLPESYRQRACRHVLAAHSSEEAAAMPALVGVQHTAFSQAPLALIFVHPVDHPLHWLLQGIELRLIRICPRTSLPALLCLALFEVIRVQSQLLLHSNLSWLLGTSTAVSLGY